ncbi:MAG: hypothetical protein ACOX9R_01220 [Armatimonadota bacterium]|jgi:hypothetical protein
MQYGSHARIIVTVALAALLAVPLAAQPPLLNSSAPGAFGVRYLPDRAVVTYTVDRPADSQENTFTLRVRLPERVQWGFVDGDPIPGDELRWDRGQAIVQVPFGSQRLHLGWTDEAFLPPDAAEVPVFVGDRRVGSLTARFDLQGMLASGGLQDVGPGMAALKVELTEPLHPDSVSLSAGSEAISKWRYDGTSLEARDSVYVEANPRLSLRVEQRGLRGSPVERVVLTEVDPPSQVIRIPDDRRPEGVLVEGEDFVAWTGTQPQVEPGRHHGTSGDAVVFSFIGDGTTIDWTVDIPEDGLWDLYVRMACGDVGAWRSVAVNGQIADGLDLVAFPGTGGWGYADDEWWIVRLTGGEGQAPPLELNAGEQTLTMTGLLTTHMNIDYLLFVPHD